MPENPDRPPLEEKDHYSYQEMLERLEKVRSSGHGMKTKRKRKRRSHQPIKEKRKSRFVKTMLFLGVFLPLLIVLAGSLFFSYMAYQSDPFRIAISELVSGKLGVEGQFSRRFHISKGNFFNEDFSGKGGSGDLVQKLEARKIQARVPIGTLFRKHWGIESLVVEDLSVTLNPFSNPKAASPNQALPRILAAGLGMTESPESVELKRFSLNNVDLIFGSDTTKRPNHILGAKATFTGATIDESMYHGTIRDGELLYSFWPMQNLVEANIIVHPNGEIEITSGRLEQDTYRGRVDVSGTMKFNQPDRGAQLELNVTDLDVNQIFLQRKANDDDLSWADYVQGKISGKLTLLSTFERDGDTTITGSITGTEICVKQLPMLEKLARFSEHYLDRITFTSFKAELEQTNHILKLKDIIARVGHDGIGRLTDSFAITGDLTMDSRSGKVRGNLDWRFDTEYADKFRGGRPSFLSGKQGESGSVNVIIQGTLKDMFDFANQESGYTGPPTDTLSPLLEIPEESITPPR